MKRKRRKKEKEKENCTYIYEQVDHNRSALRFEGSEQKEKKKSGCEI